jgi:hypothetical protein
MDGMEAAEEIKGGSIRGAGRQRMGREAAAEREKQK